MAPAVGVLGKKALAYGYTRVPYVLGNADVESRSTLIPLPEQDFRNDTDYPLEIYAVEFTHNEEFTSPVAPTSFTTRFRVTDVGREQPWQRSYEYADGGAAMGTTFLSDPRVRDVLDEVIAARR